MKDFQILGDHGIIHYDTGKIILFLYSNLTFTFKQQRTIDNPSIWTSIEK